MVNKKKIFDITPPPQVPQKPAVVVREPEIKKPLVKKFRVNKPILITIALLIIAVLCFIFIEHRAVIGFNRSELQLNLPAGFLPQAK